MSNIGSIAADILQDYMAACGRSGTECMVSVEEYLLIRDHAMQEIKNGMHMVRGRCEASGESKVPVTNTNIASVGMGVTSNTATVQQSSRQRVITLSSENATDFSDVKDRIEQKSETKTAVPTRDYRYIEHTDEDYEDTYGTTETTTNNDFLKMIAGIPD